MATLTLMSRPPPTVPPDIPPPAPAPRPQSPARPVTRGPNNIIFAIDKALCSDGRRRRASITPQKALGFVDVWGQVTVKGRRVSGRVLRRRSPEFGMDYVFAHNEESLNGYVLPPWGDRL